MENLFNVMIYGVAISVLMFAGSLIVGSILIVRMPADYLTRDRATRSDDRTHVVFRIAILILRNAIGIVLLGAGLIMLVTPGQGILFIFLGLMFLDFPGKHRLIERMIRQPRIYRSINKIRARTGKPPIELPATIVNE